MATRVLVTGANRGLGRATAEKLARRGCRLVLAVRSLDKGQAAATALRAQVPGAAVEVVELDLADLASVRRCGEALGARGESLDVLLNSAGVMQQSPVRRTTRDGFEETLATNVLGPFLLTKLLLPSLRRAPAARVVNVSSRMHLPGSRGPEVRFDFADPNLERDYQPDVAYKNSKLAMMWFTYALARRLEGSAITANAVCPGFVPTTAAESTHGAMKLLMRWVMPLMPFATSADAASTAFADMCTDAALARVRGKFYADGKPMPSSPESYDEAKQERFWAFACSAVGATDWP
jgi:NAD(P)-dependent dehydrogenase (short-subunit alcohol dehydrogenase family)